MASVFGLTERNKQPEPPDRKPNEDDLIYWQGGNHIIAIVMDGIPVLRNSQSIYPKDNGSVASRIATKSILEAIKDTVLDKSVLRLAFDIANREISIENTKRRTYHQNPPCWIATVGCAVWIDIATRQVVFGYIGDPFGFVISPQMKIKIITDDQLRHFEGHLYTCHSDTFKDPGTTVSIRAHQDKYVRNIEKAHCFCGKQLKGWGALTGETSAMRFVKISSFKAQPGTRIILASDAIEAIGAGNAKARRPEDYTNAFRRIRDMDVQRATEELLRLTREGEKEKHCKSDDATIAVIDL